MKRTILLQLDPDPQPSVFDAVVAIDSGVEHLLRHHGVTPEAVRDLVHGALFTRGLGDLHRTAIFVGGSSVAAAEGLLAAVKAAFFGPFRVSVLFDPNGCNTTAAAAVMAALDAFDGQLAGVRATVLGGTGPVGLRVARLLAREGADVLIASRAVDRARAAAEAVGQATGSRLRHGATDSESALRGALEGAQLVVAAGAAGVTLLPESVRDEMADLKAAIDLNAVPPLGIEGFEANDKKADRSGVQAWGALGVGGTKMKIHKKALEELFMANDRVIDAEEALAIGRALAGV